MKCWRIFHFFLFFVYDGTYIFRVWEAMNSASLGICSVLENTGVERECRHHLHQCLSRGSILSDLSRASVDKMDTSWAPWLKWRWPDCPPNFSTVQLILPLLSKITLHLISLVQISRLQGVAEVSPSLWCLPYLTTSSHIDCYFLSISPGTPSLPWSFSLFFFFPLLELKFL